jgi:hypothetical protein
MRQSTSLVTQSQADAAPTRSARSVNDPHISNGCTHRTEFTSSTWMWTDGHWDGEVPGHHSYMNGRSGVGGHRLRRCVEAFGLKVRGIRVIEPALTTIRGWSSRREESTSGSSSPGVVEAAALRA